AQHVRAGDHGRGQQNGHVLADALGQQGAPAFIEAARLIDKQRRCGQRVDDGQHADEGKQQTLPEGGEQVDKWHWHETPWNACWTGAESYGFWFGVVSDCTHWA